MKKAILILGSVLLLAQTAVGGAEAMSYSTRHRIYVHHQINHERNREHAAYNHRLNHYRNAVHAARQRRINHLYLSERRHSHYY